MQVSRRTSQGVPGAPPYPVPVDQQTSDVAATSALVHDMRRLLMTYRFGMDELMTKILVLRDEFREIRDYNPIEHIGSRVKSIESIVDKANRKGIPLTPDGLRAGMFDIAGIRITCGFVSDIARVRDLLVGQADLTLVEERDYITHGKENGYKSLHLILQVPVFLSDRVENVTVEVQIRTIAMDFWASLEHKIHYKYGHDVPLHLVTELKLAADVASQLDRSMERIHDEVLEYTRQEAALQSDQGADLPFPVPTMVWEALHQATELQRQGTGGEG